LTTSETRMTANVLTTKALKCLNPKQVQMIDEAVASLGDFGEVRLIIEKGRLRFLVTQKSFDALKWQPGSLGEEQS
jgi:hypothetical protein